MGPTFRLKRTLKRHSVEKNAWFSPDGKYRYLLTRRWNRKLPTILFIGLNPSTADKDNDDATIRRLIGFAQSWGFGGLKIINLYAYVAKNRQMLGRVADPVGPHNDHYFEMFKNKKNVVFMWGCSEYITPEITKKAYETFRKPKCFGQNKDGLPWHPLYLDSKLRPKKFEFY